MTDTPHLGRPSKYDPALCEVAFTLASQGATDIEIADALGIHVATYYRWRAEHDAFREATAAGKESADERVEASLYHRAIGYSHDAVKIFMPAGAPEPVLAKYREHYPPDTAAASLWLRNRRPDKWRDKQDHEHTGKGGGPIEITRIERVIIDPNRRSTPAAASPATGDAANPDSPGLPAAPPAEPV